MVNVSPVNDPLDIHELIRQAEAQKKKRHQPSGPIESSRPDITDWQKLMDERKVKPGRHD